MWTSVLLFQVSSACLYRLGSVEYNLSTLHHTTFYEVHDKEIDSDFFSLAYVFNFCGNHPQTCDNYPAAYEVIDVLGQLTDSCEMIGDPKSDVAEPIENGIKVTYRGGSPCEASENALQLDKPRMVSFIVMCSTSQDDNFARVPFDYLSNTRCSLEQKRFTINSPAGCPIVTTTNGGVDSTIKTLVFLFIMYFTIGTIYNLIVHKSATIPHWQILIRFINSFQRTQKPPSPRFQPLDTESEFTPPT